MNKKFDGIPDLHDGQLTGVSISDKKVEIQAIAADGQLWTLLLHDVLRLRVTDMFEGNIIFSCDVLESSEGADDALEELFSGRQREPGVKQWKEKIDEGSYKLVTITPSYGATVIALVKFVKALHRSTQG